jgi:hypothetical protein
VIAQGDDFTGQDEGDTQEKYPKGLQPGQVSDSLITEYIIYFRAFMVIDFAQD